jgi:uncharacterized membrane protein YgaE (UPF0421/DUF939 family)
MKLQLKKPKPTLESLLNDDQVITGNKLIERAKDIERQKALLEDAIEFERRNRRNRDPKEL